MLFEFIGGIVVGVLTMRERLPASRTILGVGIAAFFVACLSNTPFAGLGNAALGWHRALTAGVAGTILVYGAVACEERGEQAPWWLVRVGDASYTMYLFHGAVIGIVALAFARGHLHGRIADITFLVASILAVVVASLAISRLVERPLVRMFRRFGKSTRPMSHGVDAAVPSL
jgi:peptidoglycan/LPS O-acetylase OafA/YrhL